LPVSVPVLTVPPVSAVDLWDLPVSVPVVTVPPVSAVDLWDLPVSVPVLTVPPAPLFGNPDGQSPKSCLFPLGLTLLN
jgi:hypothetical protein